MPTRLTLRRPAHLALLTMVHLWLVLALAAHAAPDLTNAQATLVLDAALADGRALVVTLETTHGAVTRAISMPTGPVDASALTLDAARCSGVLKLALGATAYRYTLQVTGDAGTLTGTFTGTVGETAVKGTVAGALIPRPAPFGGKDFYPSADRPVGFRGDGGNGYYPGATPVSEWREGTLVQRDMEVVDRGAKKTGKAWDFADAKAKNIVWKTELPSWANSQPIVVGDRVFTYGEPNYLFCVDANTGKLLWSARVNPWEAAGVEQPLADKLQEMHDIARYGIPFFPAMTGTSTVYRVVPEPEMRPMTDLFTGACLPRMVAALKELDPEGAAGYDTAAKAVVDGIAAYLPTVGQKTAITKPLMALSDYIDKRIQTLSKQKVPIHPSWGHMVGWAMSVPVSDGECVYASLGQGGVACYDLNGNRRWIRYSALQPGARTQWIQSPMLAGDVLVDCHGGTQLLRGFNTRTGELLWEAPTAGVIANGKGGGYYVGSHKIVRLTNGKDTVDVIVTQLCNIIRASDGKVLGSLPFEGYGPSGGPTVFNVGDIVFKACNGDGGSSPLFAYRLTLVDRDTVKADILWQTKDRCSPGYHGQVATDQAITITTRTVNVMNPFTGEVALAASRNGIGDMSNTRAGTTFLWCEGGSSSRLSSYWSGRRADGKTLAIFYTADVADPAKPKRLSTNILGGADWPRIPAMEKYAPELYAHPDYHGQAYGKPPHGLHTDTAVAASGNRLFIRTVTHLYCIGDPAVPYDWNPESRPKAIADMLKDGK